MTNTFELDISRFVEKAKGNVDLVFRKISIEVFKRVILKSPVLTGRFRANWQVAIGSVPAGTLQIDDKAGTATIAKVTATALQVQAGQIITLVNNLAYALPLEYGHSKQAPNGMVRLTVLEFGGIVNKAANELPK